MPRPVRPQRLPSPPPPRPPPASGAAPAPPPQPRPSSSSSSSSNSSNPSAASAPSDASSAWAPPADRLRPLLAGGGLPARPPPPPPSTPPPGTPSAVAAQSPTGPPGMPRRPARPPPQPPPPPCAFGPGPASERHALAGAGVLPPLLPPLPLPPPPPLPPKPVSLAVAATPTAAAPSPSASSGADEEDGPDVAGLVGGGGGVGGAGLSPGDNATVSGFSDWWDDEDDDYEGSGGGPSNGVLLGHPGAAVGGISGADAGVGGSADGSSPSWSALPPVRVPAHPLPPLPAAAGGRPPPPPLPPRTPYRPLPPLPPAARGRTFAPVGGGADAAVSSSSDEGNAPSPPPPPPPARVVLPVPPPFLYQRLGSGELLWAHLYRTGRPREAAAEVYPGLGVAAVPPAEAAPAVVAAAVAAKRRASASPWRRRRGQDGDGSDGGEGSSHPPPPRPPPPAARVRIEFRPYAEQATLSLPPALRDALLTAVASAASGAARRRNAAGLLIKAAMDAYLTARPATAEALLRDAATRLAAATDPAVRAGLPGLLLNVAAHASLAHSPRKAAAASASAAPVLGGGGGGLRPGAGGFPRPQGWGTLLGQRQRQRQWLRRRLRQCRRGAFAPLWRAALPLRRLWWGLPLPWGPRRPTVPPPRTATGGQAALWTPSRRPCFASPLPLWPPLPRRARRTRLSGTATGRWYWLLYGAPGPPPPRPGWPSLPLPPRRCARWPPRLGGRRGAEWRRRLWCTSWRHCCGSRGGGGTGGATRRWRPCGSRSLRSLGGCQFSPPPTRGQKNPVRSGCCSACCFAQRRQWGPLRRHRPVPPGGQTGASRSPLSPPSRRRRRHNRHHHRHHHHRHRLGRHPVHLQTASQRVAATTARRRRRRPRRPTPTAAPRGSCSRTARRGRSSTGSARRRPPRRWPRRSATWCGSRWRPTRGGPTRGRPLPLSPPPSAPPPPAS
ncbi:hypothetical protein I4F81_010095 [Pyropia yezoensis]|uniref:Uncharacterized protein n=1 Tax=Pyropia yezoensis TaxID=2788 RepID=A0ACC3CBC4_PYRYE|nr:hypothetical protein I4F81_010095 [Neopyropia yezoensis]